MSIPTAWPVLFLGHFTSSREMEYHIYARRLNACVMEKTFLASIVVVVVAAAGDCCGR